jgi:tRNA nucleotidyltransferase (CCA-adding enzyme)
MDLLDKVKKEIRPDKGIMDEIDEFVASIDKKIKSKKIKAACVPGGSVAKGTFLKGDFDVDIFVKFDRSYSEKNISDILEKLLEGQKERLHGSRDYFQLKKGELNYEVVPVLDIKNADESENVTDMSPMHVTWVKKNLKKGMEDEIRLAKKFCKAVGCYGAESHIQGFSGHVLDILIVNYGSFTKLLEGSRKWKDKTIIDVMKHYRNRQEILFTLNQSKIQGPMILIDPIQRTRNAASALSEEKLEMFRKAATGFLKRPDEKYFIEKKVDKETLQKKHRKNLFILDIAVEEGKKDVIGSRIVKAHRFIFSELEKKSFDIIEDGWHWEGKQDALIWVVLKEKLLPQKKIVNGPPLDMKAACENFKRIYGKTLKKDGRLLAETRVEKRDASDIINDLCKTEYFLEKAKLRKLIEN